MIKQPENIKTILEELIKEHGIDVIWDKYDDNLYEIWQLEDHYKKWLKENGYDGFYNTEIDVDGCGCDLDDLMPCSSPSLDCLPRRGKI